MVKNAIFRLPGTLVRQLQGLSSLAVAFSGGIDSRFLCHAASICGCDVLAIHAAGSHVPSEESLWAKGWAKSAGIRFVELVYNPLKMPAVANNTRKRCYFCKQELIMTIQAWLKEHGEEGRKLCDGSNIDDMSAFRPGALAIMEAGVISPLALAGMGKREIRAAALETALEWPSQPGRPCLLTRFPYDYPINVKELAQVQYLEKAIAEILVANPDPPDYRLRFCPEPVLHLTGLPQGAERKLMAMFAENGITDVSIEVMPELSGFFDRVCQSDSRTLPAEKDDASL